MLTQKFLNKNYTFSTESLEAPHNLPWFKPRAKGTKNYCLTAPASLDHLLETRDVQTRDNREPRTSQTTNSRYDNYLIYLHHTSLYTVHPYIPKYSFNVNLSFKATTKITIFITGNTKIWNGTPKNQCSQGRHSSSMGHASKVFKGQGEVLLASHGL